MELGTGLALVAFADQCIKYGTKLVKRCKSYRHAVDEARAFLVTIEHNWRKTEAQIKFLKSIATTLDEDYLEMQSLLLSELEGQLKTATLTLDQLIEKSKRGKSRTESNIIDRMKSLVVMTPGQKIKYAFEKGTLQDLVNGLEKWQGRFDPCWMLIMRIESRSIDNELSRETQKPPAQQIPFIMAAKEMRDAVHATLVENPAVEVPIWLDADSYHSSNDVIEFSPISIHLSKSTGNSLVIETMRCNIRSDIDRTTKDARDLAQILHKINSPNFGLLKCQGIIKRSETVTDQFGHSKALPTFSFVFEIPKDFRNPRTLRGILQEAAPFPLNERLDLARRLTYSVLYIHSARFVHKSIRPETILVFENVTSNIGAPFLVGFEKFRPADGHTYLIGDESWEKNLYRHPTRQGILPEEQYKMQHDVYSIGVVLLEIGLWTSLVTYPRISSPNTEGSVPVASEYVKLMSPGEERDPRQRAFRDKEMLENLAEQAGIPGGVDKDGIGIGRGQEIKRGAWTRGDTGRGRETQGSREREELKS
ncbi:hypothetical protein VE04_07538 [Pseudogymnoascus sp. 24MN13]|nr:hypothetical protein VE04_07538 [Pseudogymnoascus sp. 24MN13]